MSEIDHDQHRKLIEQGLAQILVQAAAAGTDNISSLQLPITGDELPDAIAAALKAYADANN